MLETKEKITKKAEEIVKEIPKILLLENCPKILGPSQIPSASPVKTATKRIP